MKADRPLLEVNGLKKHFPIHGGVLGLETAKVYAVERRVIRFEVASFDGERKIGEGRHARALVNIDSFNKRFGAA